MMPNEMADRNKPIDILFIDDDYEDFLLTEAMLSSKARKDFRLKWAESAESGFDALQKTNPDVCLVDYRLGPDDGLEFVRRIVESGFDGPVILLTGMNDDALDRAALGAGAVDFLAKRDVNATMLTRAIRFGLRQKHKELELTRQATTDTLTGLRNRAAFDRELERTVASNRRSGNAFGLIFLDLDHFKAINDSLGHDAGDAVLIEVGKRLEACCRDSDVIARWGGDEFAIIFEGVDCPSDAALLADRIRLSIAEPFDVGGAVINTTSSVGILFSEAGNRDFDNLVRLADQALYSAKEAGRNRIAFFDDLMNDALLRRSRVHALAAAAVAGNRIAFATQPVVSIGRHSVEGMEVLLRLNDGAGVKIAAGDAIAVAINSDLIWDMTRLALKTAADVQARAGMTGISDAKPFIGINLADRQLARADVLDRLEVLVKSCGVADGTLEFDISEAALARDADRAQWIIEGIHRLGARVSMDDFGLGDVPLTHLARLPLDRLKIDRSLVRDVVQSPSSRAICESVLRLSRSLFIPTVAVGVETEVEARFFRAAGCDMMQGDLSGPPVLVQAS
ncbi:MAG: EAL domain-containing protein [Minwuia sp.]|nr:EAL domain-containing protein [Minwuia sp.]